MEFFSYISIHIHKTPTLQKNELKKVKIRASHFGFYQKFSDTVGQWILLFLKSFKLRLEWLSIVFYCFIVCGDMIKDH